MRLFARMAEVCSWSAHLDEKWRYVEFSLLDEEGNVVKPQFSIIELPEENTRQVAEAFCDAEQAARLTHEMVNTPSIQGPSPWLLFGIKMLDRKQRVTSLTQLMNMMEAEVGKDGNSDRT